MKQKEINKELRELASHMPIIMRSSVEYEVVKGDVLIEQGIKSVEMKDGTTETVDPEKFYLQPAPVQIAINHYQKMKKIFSEMGVMGINAYTDAVLKYAAENKLEENFAPVGGFD